MIEYTTEKQEFKQQLVKEKQSNSQYRRKTNMMVADWVRDCITVKIRGVVFEQVNFM